MYNGIHTYMCVCMCALYIHTYMCVCMCVCVCVYKHIYTHTDIRYEDINLCTSHTVISPLCSDLFCRF